MNKVITSEELKELCGLDLKFSFDYKDMRQIDAISDKYNLPKCYYKKLTLHRNPLSTLSDRILKAGDFLFDGNKFIITSELGGTPGFIYLSLFVFYTDDVESIKKLFKYHKLKGFL